MRALRSLRALMERHELLLGPDEWHTLIAQLGSQDSPELDGWWSPKRHRDQVRSSILEAFRWISPEVIGAYFLDSPVLNELTVMWRYRASNEEDKTNSC